jgi:hypothetical protein
MALVRKSVSTKNHGHWHRLKTTEPSSFSLVSPSCKRVDSPAPGSFNARFMDDLVGDRRATSTPIYTPAGQDGFICLRWRTTQFWTKERDSCTLRVPEHGLRFFNATTFI